MVIAENVLKMIISFYLAVVFIDLPTDVAETVLGPGFGLILDVINFVLGSPFRQCILSFSSRVTSASFLPALQNVAKLQ